MDLVCVFGPPAVGKMAVGSELATRTGFKLLHNHMTVDPVLEIFEFGSPPFARLVDEFRRRIIEEAIGARLDGLVFTIVWALDVPADRDLIAQYVDLVESAGGAASFVELYAHVDERLRRNGTELRLAEKKSKRDTTFSARNLLEMEQTYVMNTGGTETAGAAWLAGRRHLRIDNTDLSAPATADRIVAELGLGA